MKRRIGLIIFILAISLNFGACLEWHELTQINSDGSVNYELRITVPEIPEKDKKKAPGDDVEKEISDLLKETNVKGLTPVGGDDKKVNGMNVFSIRLKGDSLLRLNQLYETIGKGDPKSKDKKKGKEAFDQLLSKSAYKVKKNKTGTLTITRGFTPPKLPKKKKADKGEGKMNQELEEMFLNMFRFKFEIFVPGDVVSNNAELVFGNNLRWETTMGYLTQNVMMMEFEIPSTAELAKSLKK